ARTEIRFPLVPAATLQGRVTDDKGKPIAGATVFTSSILNQPIAGVHSAITDAQGRYAIEDLAPFDTRKQVPVKNGDGTFISISECFLTVQHPDYGQKRPGYKLIPGTVDVQLPRAATLEGLVVDEVAGQPAAGVHLFVQGATSKDGER